MHQDLARDLLFRLDDLGRRVASLERQVAERLGTGPASGLPNVQPEHAPRPIPASGAKPILDTPGVAASPAPPPLESVAWSAEHDAGVFSPTTASPSTPAPASGQAPARDTLAYLVDRRNARPAASLPKPQAKFKSAADFERLVGARWYAGAGALIVVIGIGLFIKLAFDRGWFHVAPAVRCMLGALFGGGLIVLAEFIRKRLTPLAAVGLYAAGLGSIFISTYAAYRMYDLLAAPVTFGLLAAVGLFGVAIAIRAKLPIVAILSLVAGFITPFLFFDSPPRPLVLPAYTLTLLAVGLAVTAWKGSTFGALRRIAWWGTVLNGTIWLLRSSTDHSMIALGFLALAWAFVHAELSYSAVRGQLNLPQAFGLRTKIVDLYTSWRALLTSFSTSAWVLAFAIRVLDSWAAVPDWLAPAALLCATALLACVLAGFPRPFLETPTTDRERFAACLVVQCAGALIATVALAFSGMFEVFAWALLSLTVLLAARWLKARPFYAFSLVCLAIATVRLIVYDSWNGALTAAPYDLFGLSLSMWTVCMGLAAALWFVTARFIADEASYASRPHLPAMIAGVGCLTLLGSVLIGSTAQSLSYAWIVLALLCAIADRLDRRLALLTHAFIAGSASAAALFVAFPPWNWGDHVPFVHPGLVGAMVIVLAFAVIAGLARLTPARLVHSRAAWAMAAIVFFAATSLDVARVAERISNDSAAQRSALSIWWAVFAFGLIAVGFWRRLSTPRRVGLGLLGVTALKAVLLDLQDVPATWRVASFLGIGLLMLAVGIAYSKVSSLVDRAPSEAPPVADTPSANAEDAGSEVRAV